MKLANILNKLKSFFVKPEPAKEAPVVEVKHEKAKKLTKKVANKK